MAKLLVSTGCLLLFIVFLGVSIYYFALEGDKNKESKMEITIPIDVSPTNTLITPPVSSISGTIDTTRSSITKTDETTSSSQLNN